MANRSKLLKIVFFVVCVVAIGLSLGLYFGLSKAHNNQISAPKKKQESMLTQDEELAKLFLFSPKGEGEGAYYVLNNTQTLDIANIQIPGAYRGLPVKEIGYGAFSGHSEIVSVSIPSTISTIKSFAFADCDNLAQISFVEGPEARTIEMYAFSNCKGLQNLTIPKGEFAFEQYAFCACTSLQTVGFDSGAKTLEAGVFAGCTNLQSASFENGLTKIGNAAFSGCSSLESLFVPASVTSIGSQVVDGCAALSEIVVDGSNSVYKSESNCVITKNGNRLIFGCNSSSIPNYVEEICANAFYGCEGLQSIEIPASVTTIGAGAFDGCIGLQSISVASGNANYESDGNCLVETASKTLIKGCNMSTIPQGTKVIAEGAFVGCTQLQSIVLPSSIKKIERYAFSQCSGLENVEFDIDTDWDQIEIDANAFGNAYNSNTITFVVNYQLSSTMTVARQKLNELECKKVITDQTAV